MWRPTDTIYDLVDEDVDDDTDPSGPPIESEADPRGWSELAPTRGAAALDGPVPESRDPLRGSVPELFLDTPTSKLDIRPELMPEVVRVIEERCKETQTAALGAMMDAMIMEGIAKPIVIHCFGQALNLLDERKKARFDAERGARS